MPSDVSWPSWIREHHPNFGAGSIQDRNWEDMIRVIRECNAQTVLEVGAGFSTLCFNAVGLEVWSFETDSGWIDFLLASAPGVEFVLYEYPNFPSFGGGQCDVAFVDGPSATPDGRLAAMTFATEHSRRIFVHDSRRKPEVAAIAVAFPVSDWTQTVYAGGLSLFVHKSLNEVYLKTKKPSAN